MGNAGAGPTSPKSIVLCVEISESHHVRAPFFFPFKDFFRIMTLSDRFPHPSGSLRFMSMSSFDRTKACSQIHECVFANASMRVQREDHKREDRKGPCPFLQ